VMLAGGTEAPIIPMVIGSMSRDGWLSKENDEPYQASRPFDRSADGMVLSEGAGMVVLEEYAHAVSRGAHIYTELISYSTVNSAFDIFTPEPNGYGIERTMKDTLREASLLPQSVSWINSQGFSIPMYDQMERRCIHNVFGELEKFPPMSAISSWVGNSIGALGGMQAVASALAMDRQMIPPHKTVHVEESPHRIRLAESAPQKTDVSVIVQNSFCFMGKNSSLVFQNV
jgi:3-oxoacyl-[acyl-carrier-protein] synthase II